MNLYQTKFTDYGRGHINEMEQDYVNFKDFCVFSENVAFYFCTTYWMAAILSSASVLPMSLVDSADMTSKIFPTLNLNH